MATIRRNDPLRVYGLSRRRLGLVMLRPALTLMVTELVLIAWVLHLAGVVTWSLPGWTTAARDVALMLVVGAVLIGVSGRELWLIHRSARDPRFDGQRLWLDAEGLSLIDGDEGAARLRLSWAEVREIRSGRDFVLQRRWARWRDGQMPVQSVFLTVGAPQTRSRLGRSRLERRAALSACAPVRATDVVGLSIAFYDAGPREVLAAMRQLHDAAHLRR